MKKSFLIFLVFISLEVQSQTYNNFRLFPSSVTQTEPVIAVNPLNSQIMFVSGVTINTSGNFRSEGIYASIDGGQNWFGSDTCKGQNIVNHGGSPRIVIDKNGTFIITHIGSVFLGVYSHFSNDLGNTWSNSYTIYNQQPEDKGTTTTDNYPSSPYYGRIYTAFVKVSVPYPISSSYSTNGGTSWASPIVVNGTPPSRCSGGSLITGNDGKVYLVWAGVNPTSPFFEDFLGFAVSNDGGVNWGVTQNAYDLNGIQGNLPSKNNIRVNGLPQIKIDKSGGVRNGWLFVVTTEKNLAPAGSDPDIILHYSSNSGNNWSAGIRVNQDPINDGKIQYFPSMDIDSTGAINILFYDDRNTSSDSAEVWLARSQDGGFNWTERIISTHRFKPKPIAGGASGYQGDLISLISVGNKLFACWMDDYSGIYQIWSAIIDINTIGIRKINSEIPYKFELKQNYPNPFNPQTKINYSINKNSFIRLSLYDINGRLISTLINEHQNTGNYEYNLSVSELNIASGIYFYSLESDNFKDTKRMIFLK